MAATTALRSLQWLRWACDTNTAVVARGLTPVWLARTSAPGPGSMWNCTSPTRRTRPPEARCCWPITMGSPAVPRKMSCEAMSFTSYLVQEEEHQGVLGVHPVLCLVEHHALLRVQGVVAYLIAPVRR